ncbi:class I SAM-dependent methyltransferase [Dickeya oryzae]|uniref:SAM-dependent methyltransferase n=1 Tax=Dickeya oryzae TaxID=1240404 RepID=UPI001AECD47F|nr:cyclopropane-fatty-acyl-phospholipid synthase family protein [Dickeya oryzae]MBP2844681.1 class I SAM-dependent methyltransferase [Dickeya oryzae]
MTDPVFALESDVPRTATIRFARWLLFRLLAGIQQGSLTLHEGNQSVHFGDTASPLRAEVNILSPGIYARLLTGGSIAAAESWMEGEWETDQLTELLQIMAANAGVLSRLENGFRVLGQPFQRLWHWTRRNRRQQARENIAAHYDLGNTFYQQFLDEGLLYSSALFTPDTPDLASAQQAKMQRLCEELALTPDDHLLEIGTGWGALAEFAARHYGCRVTTTTLSQEQYHYALARIAQAGLQDRVTVLLCDYRDLTGQFDKLVSVEMIEAVGKAFLPQFFKTCQARLRPGGKMAIQAITIQDQRYHDYSKSVDFIQRYIFPGGFLPSVTAISSLMTRHTDFVLRNLFDMGPHYAKTLAHWRQRFLLAWPEIERLGFDTRFRRMWLYYFGYCEAGFNARTISVVQLTAERV